MTLSKGSKPRPITDKQKFDDNWDKIFNQRTKQQSMTELNWDGNETRGRYGEDLSTPIKFWKHDCPIDGEMEIERGSPCNWCGMDENGNIQG